MDRSAFFFLIELPRIINVVPNSIGGAGQRRDRIEEGKADPHFKSRVFLSQRLTCSYLTIVFASDFMTQ